MDSSGNAYVAGDTGSPNLPVDDSPFPYTTYNGGGDAFVAKVDATGTVLEYCGYIGGSGLDSGVAIAVDSDFNAYITGNTFSKTSFPVTSGPDLIFNGGSNDAFVAKVKADGSALVYCGFIGGAGDDYGMGIAVDKVGNAYVAGSTASAEGFPVAGGPDLSHNGMSDSFVAKVKVDGKGLDYCGFIGGAYDDFGFGIAVDGSGNAYVTGGTISDNQSFPVTGVPDLLANNKLVDAFIAKIREDDFPWPAFLPAIMEGGKKK